MTLGVSRKARSVGGTALRVRDITLKKKDRYILNHISLELKKGEILGIAGIEGNGQKNCDGRFSTANCKES